MAQEIGIAVVGAGYWGNKLVEEYIALSNKLQEVKLRAVVDGSPEILRNVSARFSLPSSMLKQNFEEVLKDPEVTGVHIATPNETHYDLAMKAIAAGKNVLLEKPMCLTSSDAFKLARSAEKNNLVLLIGHIFRFNNAINKVKYMFETKELTGVRCVELRWASAMPPPPNRDIIFDLAPHPVDILNHIFEEWPTQVYAKGRSFERKQVGLEEVAYITLDFPEKIIATIALSWLHYGQRDRTLNIISEKNSVRVEAVDQTIRFFENGSARDLPVERNNTIASEISHFVDCILNNDPPINSALTGIMNVTILETIRKSMQENNVMTVMGK